jgi:hypothetical protein
VVRSGQFSAAAALWQAVAAAARAGRPQGNVVFTDTISGGVRVVAVKDGTFHGEAMTARDIYAVAGGEGDGVQCRLSCLMAGNDAGCGVRSRSPRVRLEPRP